ncbi:hypothetical protein GCM10027318_34090 [Massilia agilis]
MTGAKERQTDNEGTLMDEPMISRDTIRARARDAFARGADRDQHGFESHQYGAITEWQAEWDRCQAENQDELEAA